MKWLLTVLVLCSAAFGQAPVLFYLDVPTGMCTGGKDNKGSIITIDGNNFGLSQDATHYVQLGTSTKATYLKWTNTEIAFQLECALADGTDTTISVVTPSGTSNTLPMHIYTGGQIYFFANAPTGSDSNPCTYVSPCLTSAKATALLQGGSGRVVHFMPDYWDKTGNAFGYLQMTSVVGAATKWNAALGYPTESTHTPKFSCPDMTSGCTLLKTATSLQTGIVFFNSAYTVIGNLRTYFYSSDPSTNTPGGIETYNQGQAGSAWQYVRIINIEISGDGFTVGINTVWGGFLKILGLYLHDISNSFASKHSGGIYIGDSTHDVEIGWSTLDESCAVAGTCHSNKGLEFHATQLGGTIPAPVLGSLSSSPGGSLAAGTYDVQVSYRSRVYYGNWAPDPVNCYPSSCNSLPTESDISNVQKITVGANDKITVTAPTGYNAFPGFGITNGTVPGDGVSTLCNPSLALRVFACLESGGTCTPTLQGETLYTNLTSPGNSTASPYVLSSVSTTTPYQTPVSIAGPPPAAGGLYQTTITGCNLYNLSVHDNKFIDWPGYSWTLQNVDMGPSGTGYLSFYNNEVINGGNNGSWLQGHDDQPFGCSVGLYFYGPPWDGDTRDAAEAHTFNFFNNTFYNSGKVYGGGLNGSCGSSFLSNTWSNSAYGTRTLNFTNNVMVQPQNGQVWIDPGGTAPTTNFVITGDHNLCFGYGGANCSANFNSGGGVQNQPPGFTAAGTPVSAASGDTTGGIVYTGYNVKPAAGSAAINNGTNTSSYGVLYDILGVLRPQQSIYDIGNYEYSVGGATSAAVTISGASISGATIK